MTKIQKWMLLLCLCSSMSAFAAIFECEDEQGHIKYQDSECSQSNDNKVIQYPSGAFVKPYQKNESLSQSYDSTSIADNYQQGLQAYQRQDYKRAFSFLFAAASLNHPESQNMLGGMYLAGQGVPKSEQIALSWFKRSADLGYVTAQTNLAYMYHQGVGSSKDVFLAKAWYQKAIAKGDVRAKKLLAELDEEAALNLETKKVETQKYQPVYDNIKNPSVPTIKESSAINNTSWMLILIFVVLPLVVLLINDKFEKAKLAKDTQEFDELKTEIQTPYKLEYDVPIRHHLSIAISGLVVFLLTLYDGTGFKISITFFSILGFLLFTASIVVTFLKLELKKANIVFKENYIEFPPDILSDKKSRCVNYKDIREVVRHGFNKRFLNNINIMSTQGMFTLSTAGFKNKASFFMFLYLLELGIKKQLPQENQNGLSEANKHPKQKLNENKIAQQYYPFLSVF